jgi:hypothetical protein
VTHPAKQTRLSATYSHYYSKLPFCQQTKGENMPDFSIKSYSFGQYSDAALPEWKDGEKEADRSSARWGRDSLCPSGAAFVSTDSAAPSGFLEMGWWLESRRQR